MLAHSNNNNKRKNSNTFSKIDYDGWQREITRYSCCRSSQHNPCQIMMVSSQSNRWF